jgi:hypothetical protein
VVFGGRDKKLHCVKKADGSEIWGFPTRGKVDSSPVICAGKVIVGSDDGRLYVVSLSTGKELWQYEIGEALTSSPAVAEERIVIGSDDGNVYCFGARNDSSTHGRPTQILQEKLADDEASQGRTCLRQYDQALGHRNHGETWEKESPAT